MKCGRWDGSGGCKGIRRRKTSADEKFEFPVQADAVPASRIGRVRPGEHRNTSIVELLGGGKGVL